MPHNLQLVVRLVGGELYNDLNRDPKKKKKKKKKKIIDQQYPILVLNAIGWPLGADSMCNY